MLEKILKFFSGIVGTVAGIAYGIGVLLPLNIIGLPLWADFLILVAVQFPLLNLVGVVMWIWGLVIVIGNPITWLSIVYFVLFGAVVLYWLIAIIAMFGENNSRY